MKEKKKDEGITFQWGKWKDTPDAGLQMATSVYGWKW